MAQSLMDIKRALDANIGKRITVKVNGGRRRTTKRSGLLEETYPSVFTVKLDENENAFERVSYSYADILTETVELMLTDDGVAFPELNKN